MSSLSARSDARQCALSVQNSFSVSVFQKFQRFDSMIFSTIIAVVFGFLLTSLGLILEAKIGVILSGLAVAVFGFLGSQRLAHNKRPLEMITGGIGALAPVWLVPWWSAGPMGYSHYLPALIIVTFSILAAIALTAWWQRRHG